MYAALADIAEAAGSSAAARELFKGDGTIVSPGNAAAIIALLAGEGRLDPAVELLGSVAAAHPGKPWAAAPWFTPELAVSVPVLSIGRAVSAIWQAVGNPAPPEQAEALAPWLALAHAAADRPDMTAACLCAFSALARRLGAYEDALAWCVTAEQLETRAQGGATQNTLIMLGFARRDAGQPEQAIEVWTRAAALTPVNADLLLDLADLTLDQGDAAQSLRWAERSLALDRASAKRRAAVLAARCRTGREGHEGGDGAELTELVDLVLAHPESGYVRGRLGPACAGATWLQTVPVPTEAICVSYGYFANAEESGEGRVTRYTSHATSLEAPTPTVLHRTRFPQGAITAAQPVEPDPRTPVTTEFGPPLWTYQGTEAAAAVAPPSPRAVELLQEVAVGVWGDPLVAYERAAAFAALDPDDLLGLLAHMPPPRGVWVDVQREFPLYWERFAQVWVCLGLLHHKAGEPWSRSARRTLLLRLLYGPEDWTVDAAAFALCVAAWRTPGHRTEIAGAIARRYRHAALALGKRPTELHDPLAQIVLICPGMDQKTVRLARKNLAARPERAAGEGGGDAAARKTGGSLLRRWARRKDG